jgi:hypothetical protein
MVQIQLPIAAELGLEYHGILEPMTVRPGTTAPVNEVVNVLLLSDSTLTRASAS